MIYLASPYSHPDAAVRERRFVDACRAAAALMRCGHVVFSPIAHSHPLAAHGLPGDWTFWQRLDRELLPHAHGLIVLTLEGWEQSRGVAAEVALAEELGLRVRHMALEEALAEGA